VADKFDAIVIGAGQAGGPLASTLAKAGWKVALAEEKHIGGTCVNEGCTPTKTMVASARVAYLARRGADYGVHTGDIQIDMKKIVQRKSAVVDQFREGGEKSVHENPNIEFFDGHAQFVDAKTVEVRLTKGGTRQMSADKIFINTGLRPSTPHIAGIETVAVLDSTSIMELDSVPEHLIVIGGGYIGLEFGQMFRRFGSQVTIIQSAAQLLGREDPDVAEEVAKILREDGITVLLNANAQRAAQSNDGHIEMTINLKDGGQQIVRGSHVLMAAGRVPNTDKLNLAAAGIVMDDKGFIKTNEALETNVSGIYAIGDVKGGPAFTHISYDDFRILRSNLLDGKHETTRERLVPYTVFIDPQLGRVGLNETEAREQKLNFRVAKMPMSSVARAIEVDETRGFMKAIVDADTQQILGCMILGLEGGEIMTAVQMAMIGKLPYPVLRDGVFAHPTLCESLNNLFTTLDEN